jgi:uncharacterized protein YndB with AHSA1/START domain
VAGLRSFKELKVADRAHYEPGAASGARVQKDGDKWTLIVVRELRHPPELVWEALTDPAQLAEWAPFDPDRNLSTTGPVRFSTARSPAQQSFDTTVRRAEPPRLLEYSWGENDLRWELEPHGAGTRLTLWHNIDRHYITWGAAGWQICFDVLDRLLAGDPVGRIVGADAMQHGWRRLVNEYAQQFGIEPSNPAGNS